MTALRGCEAHLPGNVGEQRSVPMTVILRITAAITLSLAVSSGAFASSRMDDGGSKSDVAGSYASYYATAPSPAVEDNALLSADAVELVAKEASPTAQTACEQ